MQAGHRNRCWRVIGREWSSTFPTRVSAAPGSPHTLVRLNESAPASWTRELHGLKGNQLYADGHAERVNARTVNLPRRNAPVAMDLLLPSVKPASAPRSVLASLDLSRRLTMPMEP